MQSPLELKSYHFAKINLEESQEGVREKSVFTIKCDLSFGRPENNERLWEVKLIINLNNQESQRAAYTGGLCVIGVFEVSEEWPREKITPLVSINAPSILYSAAREMLMIISSRFRYGHVMLPSINFLDVPRRWEAQDNKEKQEDLPGGN